MMKKKKKTAQKLNFFFSKLDSTVGAGVLFFHQHMPYQLNFCTFELLKITFCTASHFREGKPPLVKLKHI